MKGQDLITTRRGGEMSARIDGSWEWSKEILVSTSYFFFLQQHTSEKHAAICPSYEICET
jgi:hypothetical protein